jgi:pyrimidine operon attenuation protein/uracil phosphoribosyltransferase
MSLQAPQIVADQHGIDGLVDTLAEKIRSETPDLRTLAFVGIRRRGDILAARLAKVLGVHDVGLIDITLYRDDLSETGPAARVGRTTIPFAVQGRDVIVCDDVIMTGRSVLAALREILDYGRPSRIRLAVLIERPERELPIHPQFSAKKISPASNQKIDVRLTPEDAEDRISINTREPQT